ncbi:MAG: hypothetical protein R3Y54_05485 [Eubacteriales bacterium]
MNKKYVKYLVAIGVVGVLLIGLMIFGGIRAQGIALAEAGLTKSEVSFVRASLDYDDFMFIYDVEWFIDRVEYQYEVEAFTGQIIGFEIDR